MKPLTWQGLQQNAVHMQATHALYASCGCLTKDSKHITCLVCLPLCNRVYRTSALYNGTLLGFPYGARLSFMYLRSDILQANNLPVPATWDDVLLTAQRLNGSDFNNDGQAGETYALLVFRCILPWLFSASPKWERK